MAIDVTSQMALIDAAIAQAQVAWQAAQAAADQARNQLAALQEQRHAIASYGTQVAVTQPLLAAAATEIAALPLQPLGVVVSS